MHRPTVRRGLAAYVIVEPALRNALQVLAGVAAVATDHLLIGVALIAWATIDVGIKVSAGLLLWGPSRG